MSEARLLETFSAAAELVGAQVRPFADAEAALTFIGDQAGGPVVVPAFPSGERLDLAARLERLGLEVTTGDLRAASPLAAAGVTGANFAVAETGTLVLESTPEAIRLASTLPPRHFVLLDSRKIVADGAAAVPILRRFHEQTACYLAYVTGPSRTADIERVLTIGVHGPRELYILLVEGISEDFLEM